MSKTKVEDTSLTIDKYQKKLAVAEENLSSNFRLKKRLISLNQEEDVGACRRLKADRARCLTYKNQLNILVKTEFEPDQLN